jgi:hypothetical protein
MFSKSGIWTSEWFSKATTASMGNSCENEYHPKQSKILDMRKIINSRFILIPTFIIYLFYEYKRGFLKPL